MKIRVEIDHDNDPRYHIDPSTLVLRENQDGGLVVQFRFSHPPPVTVYPSDILTVHDERTGARVTLHGGSVEEYRTANTGAEPVSTWAVIWEALSVIGRRSLRWRKADES